MTYIATQGTIIWRSLIESHVNTCHCLTAVVNSAAI